MKPEDRLDALVERNLVNGKLIVKLWGCRPVCLSNSLGGSAGYVSKQSAARSGRRPKRATLIKTYRVQSFQLALTAPPTKTKDVTDLAIDRVGSDLG